MLLAQFHPTCRGRVRPKVASDGRAHVRADLYNPLITDALLRKLLPRQQVNIPLMLPSDLRAAIESRPRKQA
jgi:hypothetical protein